MRKKADLVREAATEGAVAFFYEAMDSGMTVSQIFSVLDSVPRFKGFFNDDLCILAFMHDEGFDELISGMKDELVL